MKTNIYWQYFLKIEADFNTTLTFVEFDANNFKAYSIEFVRLLLSIGSEVDTILKLICSQKETIPPEPNIKYFIDYLNKHHLRFYSNEALIPKYNYRIKPWEALHKNKSPDWWKYYNKLKHNRIKEFQKANLENTTNALCGLYCLLLAYFKKEFIDGQLQPQPNLLDFANTPQYRITDCNAIINGFEDE